MSIVRTQMILMSAFGLMFCATVQAAEPMNYWNIDKLLSSPVQELELTNDQGKVLGKVKYEQLAVLNEVRARIEKSSGVKADLYVVTGDKPNAFATNVITGRNLFAINLPMLDEVGNDTDALAALMGHEIAHIERNHIRQKMEAARDIQAGSQIASIFLAFAGVRGAGNIANAGANLIFGGYSRDQEREADSYGLKFAKEAGFNPYGGVRLFTKISEKHGDKWLAFLSTHPTHAERIQTMRDGIATTNVDQSMTETKTTIVTIPTVPFSEPRATVIGDYRATVFDTEERVPTLHQKIVCKLPDGSELRTTRVDCVQQEGTLVR